MFDSLMTLTEAALRRPIIIGDVQPSEDERLLLGMLDGSPSRRACIDCPASAGRSLDCAICSTRIMIELTMATPVPASV